MYFIYCFAIRKSASNFITHKKLIPVAYTGRICKVLVLFTFSVIRQRFQVLKKFSAAKVNSKTGSCVHQQINSLYSLNFIFKKLAVFCSHTVEFYRLTLFRLGFLREAQFGGWGGGEGVGLGGLC